MSAAPQPNPPPPRQLALLYLRFGRVRDAVNHTSAALRLVRRAVAEAAAVSGRGYTAGAPTVDLVVFTNMENVAGERSGGVQFHFRVQHSAVAAPGTWRKINLVVRFFNDRRIPV